MRAGGDKRKTNQSFEVNNLPKIKKEWIKEIGGSSSQIPSFASISEESCDENLNDIKKS